jgi:hypothetical protein
MDASSVHARIWSIDRDNRVDICRLLLRFFLGELKNFITCNYIKLNIGGRSFCGASSLRWLRDYDKVIVSLELATSKAVGKAAWECHR